MVRYGFFLSSRDSFLASLSSGDGGDFGLLLEAAVHLLQYIVRHTLDDTARHGKLGALAREIGVDVASSHTSFIDTPVLYI
jgi:hypothetical protein